MAEFKVTADELRSLESKMDAIEKLLTPHERALLLGVFGMAAAGLSAAGAKAMAEHKDDEVEKSLAALRQLDVSTAGATALPSLSDGFRGAFVAGPAGGTFRYGNVGPREGTSSICVSVGPVGWCKSTSEGQLRSGLPGIGDPVDIGTINVGP